MDRERGAIAFAEGRDQPGSQSRLCVKGRYGWDYAASPQRLTTPLIRREDGLPQGRAVHRRPRRTMNGPRGRDARRRGRRGQRGQDGRSARPGRRPARPGRRGRAEQQARRKPGGLVDYAEVLPHFREATWDEALDLVARRLTEIHAEGGPAAIAGFGSAKCSNEEAYLFQKLIRTGFHTNNVDHCTRLCHASSVAALFEGIGSGAVSTTYGDVINADVAIVTGSNPTANHPVASSFFKQARRNGHDDHLRGPPGRQDVRPRRHLLPAQAGHRRGVLQRRHARGDPARADRPGLHRPPDQQLRGAAQTVADYPPERAAQITGVDAATIRRVARAWGEAGAGVIFWGMGISQHTTGTDNARCLIAMCAITGNIGRPGSGLHPLRGQNNVQGSSDMGLIPMFYPDYKKADDPAVQARFERAWGTATWTRSAASPSPRSSAPRSRAACAGCT